MKISPRTKKAIDSTYSVLMKKYRIVGLSLAIVDNGEIVYSNGYGFADRERLIPATDSTVYEIGSCTKSFTSLSLLQLQERGKLDVNNSVREYLPELKMESRFDDGNPLRIADIMSHVAGLPCDIYNGVFSDNPPDMQWLISQVNRCTAMAPARQLHSYSNLGYALLGETVARLSPEAGAQAGSGNSGYGDHVSRYIFQPLNMKSSFVAYDSATHANASQGYALGKPFSEPRLRDIGAGGIHSTAADMAKYMIMFMNKGTFNGQRIASETSINEMEAVHTVDIPLNGTDNYGFGLYNRKMWVRSGADSTVMSTIGHSGGSIVFRSDFRFIPELNVGAVVLTNTDNGGMLAWGENKYQLLNQYLSYEKSKVIASDYEATRKRADLQPLPDSEIAGVYNLGDVLVKVRSARRIKVRYGLAKFVMKPTRTDPARYSGKVYILGIPVKRMPEEYAFVKVDNRVYIRKSDKALRRDSYVGVKSQKNPIREGWRSRLGKYDITGATYNRKNCHVLNAEGVTLTLAEEDGFIVMKTKGKTEDMCERFFLDIVSDEVAVIGGFGGDSGSTVRILENGDIFYTGFQFTRKK